jgi:hypothetical protein
MSKPVSMKEVAQAIRDARSVLASSLPSNTSDEVHAAILPVIVREFLDNEYVNDLNVPPGDR